MDFIYSYFILSLDRLYVPCGIRKNLLARVITGAGLPVIGDRVYQNIGTLVQCAC